MAKIAYHFGLSECNRVNLPEEFEKLLQYRNLQFFFFSKNVSTLSFMCTENLLKNLMNHCLMSLLSKLCFEQLGPGY